MQLGSAKGAAAARYKRVWVILALSIVLIGVMSAFLSRSLATLNEGAEWVAHTERVRFQLSQILQTFTDLGIGVTGYQLTHDASLFEPAKKAAVDINTELSDIQALLADDSAQAPLFARLREAVR